MSVLITGAKGQLGNELCKIITGGSAEIGGLDVSRFSDFTAVDIDDLNIADIDAVKSFIKMGAFKLIINCAAYTNVNKCETDYENAFAANALGARNLAIAAEENGADLIHASTDYVFKGNASSPYREFDVTDPQSVYGKTKLAGENYIKEFCSRYYIVRTAWLYGYEGGNFVKTMLRLGKEKDEIKVVNDQLGNPTNANDLAYHILKIAGTGEYGIYHCTGTGICSWYDFASRIMEYSGTNCKVIPCTTEQYSAEYPGSASRPAYSALDNMMLRLTVGDEMRDWDSALKCYINNLRQN